MFFSFNSIYPFSFFFYFPIFKLVFLQNALVSYARSGVKFSWIMKRNYVKKKNKDNTSALWMIHWNDISMRLVGLCLSWSSCIWQIYTSETLKQAEGVVSTVRCEGREHALGRGIKRKLDSIHSMHSTLHEDQDGQYCMVLLDVNRIRVVPLSSKSILPRNFDNDQRRKRHGFMNDCSF